ncbi:hypothetical protein Syun_006271 [Stephania yunnanensis]|uniref:Uncharacterized protein n=1 Tax=Stephania yunnanensis TaxID=152371 RepID=A0AAP0KYX2_9MAGN
MGVCANMYPEVWDQSCSLSAELTNLNQESLSGWVSLGITKTEEQKPKEQRPKASENKPVMNE